VGKAKEAGLQFFKTANPQDEFFLVSFNERGEKQTTGIHCPWFREITTRLKNHLLMGIVENYFETPKHFATDRTVVTAARSRSAARCRETGSRALQTKRTDSQCTDAAHSLRELASEPEPDPIHAGFIDKVMFFQERTVESQC
jgi:hypothetical protein